MRGSPRTGLTATLLIATALAAGTACSGDDGASSTTSVPELTTFAVEGEEGTLVFGSEDGESSLEYENDGTGGSYSFDLDGDGVVAESGAGTFEITEGEPPGWPAEFPVPQRAEVVRGSVVGATPLVQRSVTYQSPQRPGEVVDFYVGALSEMDPLVADDLTISFEGRWTGFISVTGREGGTEIGVQLVEESDGG